MATPASPEVKAGSSTSTAKGGLFNSNNNTAASNLTTTLNTLLTNTQTQATNAATSATNAATSAATASTQASNAATSATNAASSASTASTQASNASTSASTASTQVGLATTQAGIATTQAGNASTSATAANTSKLDAQKLAVNAEDSQFTLSDNTTGFSALHHAAKAEDSATTATTQAGNAATSATTSENFATKVNGVVSGSDFSSKAHAIGGTGIDTGVGSAKDWAIKTSATVGNTGEYSAKYHATQAAASAQTAQNSAFSLAVDSTPELGGDLDVLTHDIVSSSNRNIELLPNGTGKVNLDGNGSSNGVSVSDGLIEMRSGTSSPAQIDMYCEVSNAHKVSIKAPAHANYSGNVNFTLPSGNGSNGQFLKTDGSGNLSYATADLSIDTTPELGGNLDVVTHSIVSSSGRDINITPDGSGEVNISKVDINSGAIDGTPIGANSASTGAFTTINTTGNATIGGNLTVNGTQTILNTATLTVDDINITIADGAADAAAANGAGITIDGANATLTYASSGDKFVFNKALDVTGVLNATSIASATTATTQASNIDNTTIATTAFANRAANDTAVAMAIALG